MVANTGLKNLHHLLCASSASEKHMSFKMSKGSLDLSNRSTYQVRLVGVYSCDPRIVQVTFWKNVSGVYTADPRAVPEAFPINSRSDRLSGGPLFCPAMDPQIQLVCPVTFQRLLASFRKGGTGSSS